jgi:hypothetical protein
MNANYILVRLDYEGNELFAKAGGKTRFQFFSRVSAVKAMEMAIECNPEVHYTKLYRRRREGGYRWVASRVRDGLHLTVWGE